MRRSRSLTTKLACSLGLVALLFAGACGGDDDDAIPMTGNRPTTTAADEAETEAVAEEATFPVTIQAANGPVEIAEQPEQIVSLSPTATEMIFAIGAGDQVVAVDNQSNYPADAPATDLSGFEPNVEAIADYDPDLVLVENNTAMDGLEALGIAVLELPPAANLDESYAQIEQVGQATGHANAATELVAQMRTDIDELAATVPQTFAPVPVFHQIDDTLYTATAGTFIGQVYQLAGLQNIAAQLGGGAGYQQISPEQVVLDNPQWIFLAYGGDDEVAAVKARPGWNQIAAVQQDQVVTLDPDLASRWGPRTVELLETIIETTSPD